LTNTLQHAGAQEVRISAEATASTVEIVVQDDGKGFDPGRQGRGNGLGNIRRRAEAIGETVTVESSPGHGTTVKLRLRLAAAHANGKAVA
jgi:signal transduction histidine kinase